MTNQRPTYISLALLDPHPMNPRISPRLDVIEAIIASISANGEFDAAHSIIARPIGDRYQIISGHNRVEAAIKSGIDSIPAWVREMDDASAYMELVRANAQGELTALERGLHALHSGMDVRGYAASVSRNENTVYDEVKAARVAASVVDIHDDLTKHFGPLVAIHASPRWLWPALVAKMVEDGLTVDATRKLVAGIKDAHEPPQWANAESIATAVVGGIMQAREVDKMAGALERAVADIQKAELNAETHIAVLSEKLSNANPQRFSDVLIICNERIDAQANELAEKRRKEAAKQQEAQDAETKITKLKQSVSLTEWKKLEKPLQDMLIDKGHIDSAASFNKQDNGSIEWAQWSWNPVTGCLHECSYCYARDIAESSRMAKVYPNGFEPTFRPASLAAPRNTKVPKEAANDTRFKNVFTCSMADLFGRWVAAEWIEAVLATVRDNPQWNFLFLTKFPQRLSEFDVPENAWIGTTVDLQARVKNSEKAFEKITHGVRWLSVEPMLEPLKFERLDLFNWIVIGGSSRSNNTPEFHPPFEWVYDLVQQARAAGVKVYFKTNLLHETTARLLELPFDAPLVSPHANSAPAVFHYLGRKAAE